MEHLIPCKSAQHYQLDVKISNSHGPDSRLRYKSHTGRKIWRNEDCTGPRERPVASRIPACCTYIVDLIHTYIFPIFIVMSFVSRCHYAIPFTRLRVSNCPFLVYRIKPPSLLLLLLTRGLLATLLSQDLACRHESVMLVISSTNKDMDNGSYSPACQLPSSRR